MAIYIGENLLSGSSNIQLSSMPTASASWINKSVQYVGSTTSDYTKGQFYVCVENSGVYSWEEVFILTKNGKIKQSIEVQPSTTMPIKCKGTDQQIMICGGDAYNTGAVLVLNGKDGIFPGKFELIAKDNDHSYPLSGNMDGTLTWRGKEVATLESVLELIYPIGSYHFGQEHPSLGTWEEVTGDRAVWIKSGTADGSSISQKLPNITGSGSYYWGTNDGFSGAFANSSTAPKISDQPNGGSALAVNRMNFNANDSNSIYQDGANVQPNAYVMKVWKRTA